MQILITAFKYFGSKHEGACTPFPANLQCRFRIFQIESDLFVFIVRVIHIVVFHIVGDRFMQTDRIVKLLLQHDANFIRGCFSDRCSRHAHSCFGAEQQVVGNDFIGQRVRTG